MPITTIEAVVKTISVTEATHARLAALAKWGVTLEEVIIKLLDDKERTADYGK